MHELFLSATVNNEDLETALRILQGYCGMKPVNVLCRRLLWEGPRTRTPKGIQPPFLKKLPDGDRRSLLWKGLVKQLERQSYVLSAIYQTTREQFGLPEEDKVQSCDELLGTLRWNEWADPVNKPFNTRFFIKIDNEQNLCTTLTSMNHKFIREIIQEGYRFVHEDVVFEMSRYLQLPQNSVETPAVRSHLPPYESLTSFDPESKWMLTASVIISDKDDPEQMKKGSAKLMFCKSEFEGVFDLKVLDRLTFDTRVKV